MTLRPCYQVTCDAPGCLSREYLAHERSAPARAQLSALGWTWIKYRVSASGAARHAYVCPTHRDWRPSEEGYRLVGMSMRAQRELHVRRAAMLWMLQGGAESWGVLGGHLGIMASRANELAEGYGHVIVRRRREAANWTEPWAQRLRAAGAIP